jgi:hypothetical protein
MKFEIFGKGVVCNVYYIEKNKLDEISMLVRETGPGLKELLEKESDFVVNVSRGFFADSSLYQFTCTLPDGETIDKSIFEEKIAKIALEDDEFCELDDPRDFRVCFYTQREKDINKSQVAIIEYREFEEGAISIDVPCDDRDKISELKLVCESVDGYGPNGVDLATKATYGEGVVGGEEYESAEAAIMAIEIDGIRYALPEATFETWHGRVWLWVYDEETKEHGLDFFGSKALADPWVVDLIDLTLDDLYPDFDQDFTHQLRVHKFFNQKNLDWIKENSAYTKKYMECHTATRGLIAEGAQDLELPDFGGANVKLDACTLLCMFFEAYGLAGYDPKKLSELDEFDMDTLFFETLALGNITLLESIKQSFCMHFNVLRIVSFEGEESFQEMENPSLADAIRFVEEILSDPDASFHQK